jgi:iron complex outermembrane receptor protein
MAARSTFRTQECAMSSASIFAGTLRGGIACLLVGLGGVACADDLPPPSAPPQTPPPVTAMRPPAGVSEAAPDFMMFHNDPIPREPLMGYRPRANYVQPLESSGGPTQPIGMGVDGSAIYPREGLFQPNGDGFGIAGFESSPDLWQVLPPPWMGFPDEPMPVPENRLLGFYELEGRSMGAPGPTGEINRQDPFISGPLDVAGKLQNWDNIPGVEVQHRNPVELDPNIRGYKQGQIYAEANGTYLMAARPDMDTMLCKVDPYTIEDVLVTKGPYGVRYGPGFAFIDIEREPTPRYQDGFETHFRTNLDIQTNGLQFSEHETVYGGDQNYGFRFNLGDRQGGNYLSGDGSSIPAAYNNRDASGEIGYSITPHQRLELAFQQLDQTGTDTAATFFDATYLNYYNVELRLIDESPLAPWSKLVTSGWFNHTDFYGTTANKDNPNFPVISRIEFALDQELAPSGITGVKLAGTTSGELDNSGLRTAATFDLDQDHLVVGCDYRNVVQSINENFALSSLTGTIVPPTFSDNLPQATMRDPGVYAELFSSPIDHCEVAFGARFDFVDTTANAADVGANTSLPGGTQFLNQYDYLYTVYVDAKVKLDEHWTFDAAVGHAVRPPTLTERYADAMFLSVLQTGFTRVIGDPSLAPEQNTQGDFSLSAHYENFRAKIGGFQAFINDYITFEQVATVTGFDQARLLQYVNTGLATLSGGEASAEYDPSPWFTVFGAVAYVDGRDQTLDAPLLAISPLDSWVGVRWHDSEPQRRWDLEFAVRIVAAQDRLGTIRVLGGAPTVVEEETPAFAVCNLRGYYHYSKTLKFTAGVDNLFNENYLEHLDMRVNGPPGFPAPETRVLAPGITPYAGLEWIF